MHEYCDKCCTEIDDDLVVSNTVRTGRTIDTAGRRAVLHRACFNRIIAVKSPGDFVNVIGDPRNEWM